MKIITYTAIALLGALSTSPAFAGCGKPSRFNLPALSLKGRTVAERAAGQVAADATVPGKGNISGLWLSTVTAGTQTAFQSFEAFTQDGLEFLNDNGSPIEGNVCFGVWTAEGKGVKVTHPSWNYDPSGNLIGTVIIRETLTLDPNGATFTGSVSVEAFDLNGNSFGIVFEGDVSGTRITG